MATINLSGQALKCFKNTRLILLLLLVILIMTSACAHYQVKGPTIDLATVLPQVREKLRHGDWLVIRGTESGDNFISGVTRSVLSHAAIYDAEKDQVIEAKAKGIKSSTLTDFLGTARRVLVLRPYWHTEENAKIAVAWSWEKIGRPYNFTGLVGLNMPDSYYCTQLVLKAYTHFNDETPNPLIRIVRPDKLYHWGTIIYDSGV